MDVPLGASTTIGFPWTPATAGVHVLQASVQLGGDENAANDIVTATVNVAAAGNGTPQLQLHRVVAYTDRSTTVQLAVDYGNEMVVVCSPNYDRSALGPAIVRVRNASGSSFQVGFGRPWCGATAGEDFSATVHCMVVREGVYTAAEHGVKMEAVKVPKRSTRTGISTPNGRARRSRSRTSHFNSPMTATAPEIDQSATCNCLDKASARAT